MFGGKVRAALYGFVLLIALIAIWLTATNAGLALLFVQDIAQNGQTSLLKSWSKPPRRETLQLDFGNRKVAVDVFAPANGSVASGLILVPGLSPQGKDDERLIAYANTLARVGFRVFVPNIESFRELRVGPGDADQIAEIAAKLLDNKREFRIDSLGLQAVSYAVGPTVLAAAQPHLRDRIRFVVGIGGYYEVTGMIRYFTTGRYRAADTQQWRVGAPDPRAKWLFAQTNADYLADSRQRAALQAIALIMRDNLPDPIDRWEAELGADGTAILRLILNTDPDRVDAYVAALPASMRSALASLDLSHANLASDLKARLILIHGSDDPVIPVSESIKLANSVRNSDLFVIDTLFHADLGAIGLLDGFRLWMSARAVLDQIGAQ